MQIRNLVAIMAVSAMALAGCQTTGSSGGSSGPVSASVPKTVSQRSASEQRLGDENHPKIVARYGGVYKNARLTNYVDDLGRRIARVSEQPNAKWTFTVLDTPTVNAFALPGGYVYVTRGLVALAEDEAELAGVIGHEIGHVTAGHSALRQERGTVAGVGLLLGAIGLSVLGVDGGAAQGLLQLGQAAAGGVLANYSRSDELDADNLGIRYLARAGYDPYAQADFLDSLGAASKLDAKIAGRGYNANSVDFFASHPANAPRTRRAIQIAQQNGLAVQVGANRNEKRFLQMVDGIAYGDSEEQGFVRGRTFSHPKLRFTFQAPQGFAITNSANAVTANGPQNARFILDGGKDDGGSLTNYIQRTWVPGIAKETRVGRLGGLQRTRINGLEAARAVMPVEVQGRTFDALLVAVRLNGTIYRMTGLAPRGSRLLPSMEEASRTFRRLSAADAGRLKGKRIDVVTVQRGQTVASLARRMNVDQFPEERFRVLNGLAPNDTLKTGQRVKIIR
ncbi:MAG: M48 family metalloprotease [Pseudomonadota bacterium]